LATSEQCLAQLEDRLSALESDTSQLAQYGTALVSDEPALLASADEITAVERVSSWLVDYPVAAPLVLSAVGKEVEKHRELCSLLVRLHRYWSNSRSSSAWQLLGELVEGALPTMAPELRSVALFFDPELRPADGWQQGLDYVVLDGSKTTTAKEELAALERLEGRRQRLALLGYGGHEPLSSRAALMAFQIDNDLPASGEFDEESVDRLDTLAFFETQRER
jgi:hypothetical protein